MIIRKADIPTRTIKSKEGYLAPQPGKSIFSHITNF